METLTGNPHKSYIIIGQNNKTKKSSQEIKVQLVTQGEISNIMLLRAQKVHGYYYYYQTY